MDIPGGPNFENTEKFKYYELNLKYEKKNVDFFYWTYVFRGVSCCVALVCTTFLYRVVLLRGSGS